MMDWRRWAEEHFAGIDLGDERRNNRAVEVAAALAANAGKPLPRSMGGWAALVAAYRLFASPRATMEAVLEPHLLRTRDEIARSKDDCLLIEDTTELDFTGHPGAGGLGRIGNDSGRGAHLHCTLALRVASMEGAEAECALLGLADARQWVRTEPARNGRETRADRNRRPRESGRWAGSLALPERPAKGRLIYVADRESDIYEVLSERIPQGADFVIRANQARKTGSGRTVFEAVRGGAEKGSLDVTLDSRQGRPQRTARLQIASASVSILAPKRVAGRRQEAITVNIVEAREDAPEKGAGTLGWVLLTSLPVESVEDCRKIIGIYRQRWRIEEFFKCLKTGTRVEDAQLRGWDGLAPLVGFLLVVAAQLLSLKSGFAAANAWPEGADRPDERLVDWLRHRVKGQPDPGASPKNFLRSLAMLGGFLGRKSDGEPGWLLIWRGTLEAIAFMNALDYLENKTPA